MTIRKTIFRNRIFSALNRMSHMDRTGRPDDSITARVGLRVSRVEVGKGVCADTWTVGDCGRPRKARQAMEEGMWATINLG